MSYLDTRMERSATAFRCDHCRDLVQVRETGDGTVTLEPYRHPDGEYTITAELAAVPTDGPFGYKRHVCSDRSGTALGDGGVCAAGLRGQSAGTAGRDGR